MIPDSPPRVEIANRQRLLPIDFEAVTALVRFALAVEETSGAVEVAFVDDGTIAELHERFLGISGPTDVITFPHDEAVLPESERTLGEIVVSTDTAARQAPEYGADPLEEAYLYVVHGLLHLLGYDDHEEDEAERMAERQLEILAGWKSLPPSR